MNCAAQKVKRSFMDRMFEVRDIRLPALQKLCLLTLALRADADGRCFPSMEQIADDMGCSRRTVIRVVAELERAGLIAVERSLQATGKPSANTYQINCWVSDTESPIQCQAVTVMVTESHRVSVRESQEDIHLRNKKRENAQSNSFADATKATNVVNFSAWVPPSLLESEETAKVVFKEDGSLQANEAFRRYWLPDFDGDEHQLDLAILQAAPYVQPNTSRPLEALLSSQLARQVRDRNERDRRYKQASGKADTPAAGSLEEYRRELALIAGPSAEYAYARPAE